VRKKPTGDKRERQMRLTISSRIDTAFRPHLRFEGKKVKREEPGMGVVKMRKTGKEDRHYRE